MTKAPTTKPAKAARKSKEAEPPKAHEAAPPETKAAPSETKAKSPAVKGKAVKPAKSGDKPNALQQPLQPSPDLAAIVGSGKLGRGEVVSKVWAYIKSNKLQNPDDGREILADEKLTKIFGKDKVTMFEMNKHLAKHLK